MFKKTMKIFFFTILTVSVIIVWTMKGWAKTAHGELPSKTAVILHAINNNLVSLDADLEPPGFLTSDLVSQNGTLLRDDKVISINDEVDIPIRIYRYSNVENAPILLYFHGGAFLEGYGSLDTHDNVIRSLAKKTGSIVISPAYRLAPEHIFPIAVEDSYRTLEWAYENAEDFGGDPEMIAVAGDSAGGNLAAVTALKARDLDGPELFAQLLFYPLTTFRDKEFESRTMYDSGYYLLSREVMLKAREAYTPEENMWKNPYTSPLEADDLSGLPPALIITAQYDPLRDEGELYGKRLHEAGVPVKTVRYNGVMHGFISLFEIMESGEVALNESAQFLADAQKGLDPMEEYEMRVQASPSGWNRVKEEAEAFAIAAFLVGKSTFSFITQ